MDVHSPKNPKHGINRYWSIPICCHVDFFTTIDAEEKQQERQWADRSTFVPQSSWWCQIDSNRCSTTMNIETGWNEMMIPNDTHCVFHKAIAEDDVGPGLKHLGCIVECLLMFVWDTISCLNFMMHGFADVSVGGSVSRHCIVFHHTFSDFEVSSHGSWNAHLGEMFRRSVWRRQGHCGPWKSPRWLISTISVEIPLFWWGKNHGNLLFLWVQALGFRDLDRGKSRFLVSDHTLSYIFYRFSMFDDDPWWSVPQFKDWLGVA